MGGDHADYRHRCDATSHALARLVDLAGSDTGQAARVARFLMAWWNGPELGDFPIADLFGLDLEVATDIATVVGYLSQHDGALYIDAFGYREAMADIIGRWTQMTAETQDSVMG
nr:hypothetical protein [Sphingobium sp. AP50]